ncbi:MAG TPA: NAD(P)H-binding protein [Actinoplanes sp.]|nr:NAD(P)H-binding protein [Actinoplanes sp.]
MEVRRADFDDIGPDVFAGADAALVVSTDQRDGDRRAAQHAAAFAAAAEAGVGHLVYTSLVGCDGPPDLLNLAHRRSEQALRATGVPWTVLRNNLYLDGLDERQAADGRYVSNAGDGAVAYVSRERCAEVAASTLLGGARGVVDVHGPRALGTAAVAELFGARLGRQVVPVLLDDREYRDHLRSTGAPEPLVEALVELGRAVRAGVYRGA